MVPARPFDLGADRSPFLTDVAPSPNDDDDHQPDELRRWKPGATPLAVGGMLGDVYGRDDDETPKDDGDGERRNRTGDDEIGDARTPTGTTRWANDARSPSPFSERSRMTRSPRRGSAGCAPMASTSPRRRSADVHHARGAGGPTPRHGRGRGPALEISRRRGVQSQGATAQRASPMHDARRALGWLTAPQPFTTREARLRFTHESAFARGWTVPRWKQRQGGWDAAHLAGKLVVVDAPTTPATSQRVGLRLAALTVPQATSPSRGATQAQSGDARRFAVYVDGVKGRFKRCGTLVAPPGRSSRPSRTSDVVMDEVRTRASMR